MPAQSTRGRPPSADCAGTAAESGQCLAQCCAGVLAAEARVAAEERMRCSADWPSAAQARADRAGLLLLRPRTLETLRTEAEVKERAADMMRGGSARSKDWCRCAPGAAIYGIEDRRNENQKPHRNRKRDLRAEIDRTRQSMSRTRAVAVQAGAWWAIRATLPLSGAPHACTCAHAAFAGGQTRCEGRYQRIAEHCSCETLARDAGRAAGQAVDQVEGTAGRSNLAAAAHTPAPRTRSLQSCSCVRQWQ